MRSNRRIADCIAAIRETKAPLLLTVLCLSPIVICSTYASVHVVSTARCSNGSSGVQLRFGWRHFFQSMDQLDTGVRTE